MGWIIKTIKLSAVNLLYYYKERKITDDDTIMDELYGFRDDKNKMNKVLTRWCLNKVGLDMSEGTSNDLPTYVWFSSIQKDWIKIANNYGFMVKLRDA